MDKIKIKKISLDLCFILFVVIAVISLLSGCSTYPTFDDNSYYKREIIMEHESGEYIGMAVLPKTNILKLKLKLKGDGDFLLVKSCARSIEIEQAWKPNKRAIFKSKRSVKLEIDLTDPLERAEYCPIRISAMDKDGHHSFSFIDFKNTGEKLSAVVKCNGKLKVYKGVSVCNNRAGLINEIVFPEPTNSRTKCNIERIDEYTFRFKNKIGECVYKFEAKSGKTHRMTTSGYQKIILNK